MPESALGELSPIPDEEQTLPPTPTYDPPETHRTCDSRFSEVINGVGEMDSKNPRVPETVVEKPDRPYLLLDVRDKDAYDTCHIIGAVNFPSAMLSRAQNYFTQEVLEYINKDGKIIILYDEDERIAHACSTTMVERGVDNLFMLSGGLKVLNMKFPKGIIRGPLPRICLTDENGKIRKGCEKQDPTHACEHVNGNDFNLEDVEVLEETLDKVMLSMAPASRIGGMSRAQSMLSNRADSSSRAWKWEMVLMLFICMYTVCLLTTISRL